MKQLYVVIRPVKQIRDRGNGQALLSRCPERERGLC